MDSQDIIQFWFHDLSDKQRFAKDMALDSEIRQRFGSTLRAAVLGELYGWRVTPQGRLGEIVVLDQFSRNIYRDSGEAFAHDPQALALAQELVAGGYDQALSVQQRSFAYMPYMHSESLLVHEEAVRLFAQPGLEASLAFEMRHKAIIERFGRYPHRNAVLGRASTAAEQAFLAEPGSSF